METAAAIVPEDLRDELRRGLFRKTDAWPSSLLLLVLTTVIAVALKPVLDGEVSSGLIFVLGITIVGATSGLGPALVAALLSSAFFNFFLADPVLTFRMSSGSDLAPPIIFTGCAVVSGVLAGRLRDKTARLGQSNLQLESLLEASRHLQEATSEEEVFAAVQSTVPAKLGVNLALFQVDGDMPVPVGQSTTDTTWAHVAWHALSSQSDVHNHEGLNGYVLLGSRGVAGVLVSDEPTTSELDRPFMLALAQVIGLALERARFAAVVAEAEARARTEQLKTTLLSSVSHDLRTPLTTISASASSLIEYGSRLDGKTSLGLLEGIVEECDRLNRLTSNLLELSRLQTSEAALVGQTLALGDVVRAVVQRLKARTRGRDIKVVMPAQEILVVAEMALFELAIINVIQNALLYSEAGSTVQIECARHEETCSLTVTDQGCGIPPGEQEKVFERFYRVKRADAQPPGSGLGLAIARGFVEAFNGSISIKSPVDEGYGTSVTITLPLVAEPAP